MFTAGKFKTITTFKNFKMYVRTVEIIFFSRQLQISKEYSCKGFSVLSWAEKTSPGQDIVMFFSFGQKNIFPQSNNV